MQKWVLGLCLLVMSLGASAKTLNINVKFTNPAASYSAAAVGDWVSKISEYLTPFAKKSIAGNGLTYSFSPSAILFQMVAKYSPTMTVVTFRNRSANTIYVTGLTTDGNPYKSSKHPLGSDWSVSLVAGSTLTVHFWIAGGQHKNQPVPFPSNPRKTLTCTGSGSWGGYAKCRWS